MYKVGEAGLVRIRPGSGRGGVKGECGDCTEMPGIGVVEGLGGGTVQGVEVGRGFDRGFEQ